MNGQPELYLDYAISLVPSNEFNSTVALSISSTLPTGVTASWIASPSVGAGAPTTLRLTTTTSTPAGSYPVTVQSDATHTVALTLVVGSTPSNGAFTMTVLKGYESLKEGVEGTLGVRLKATSATAATVSFSGLTVTPPTVPSVPGVAATCDAPKANGVTVPAGGVAVPGSTTLDITMACRGLAGSAPGLAYLTTNGPNQYDSVYSFHPYLVNLTANATGQTAQTLSAPMNLTIMPATWLGPAHPGLSMSPTVVAGTEETVVLSGSWPFNGATPQPGMLMFRFVDAGAAGPLATAGSCSLGLISNGGSHLLVDNGTLNAPPYIWLADANPGTVENSQCSVTAVPNSMVASGGNMQFTLKVRFKTGWNNRWVRVFVRGYTDPVWPSQFSGWREYGMVKIGTP